MSGPPSEAEQRRRLPWVLAHGMANTVFSQLTFFGPVFILFLAELGLPKTQIGLLLSLLPFAGLLALFVAPAISRAGVKRVFLVFWALRKGVAGCLLLTPWVLQAWGPRYAFLFVAGLVALFAVCRAIGETAYYPWFQEVVPNSIRGQFTALSGVTETIGGVAALVAASYAIDRMAGLLRFNILLGAGVAAGILCVLLALPIPGGQPSTKGRAASLQTLREAGADRNFRRYLAGLGLVTAAMQMISFVPLYMRDQVGLRDGQILLLQVAAYGGGLLSGYLWGWAADRYGSRPVMQSGLFLMALLPVLWLLMPRHSGWSNPAAVAIAALAGVATYGWTVSHSRLLYVSVVPPEKRIQYLALFYAWSGLVGGIAPLAGGAMLDALASVKARVGFLEVDHYSLLFAAAAAALVGGRALLARVQGDSALSVRDFVGMFVRGNPLQALRALVRYRWAHDEASRIVTTAGLGEARSPLSVQELLEALDDPSHSVRLEALVAIGRTRPHPRLTQALAELIRTDTADLGPMAAWALGRQADAGAVPVLRRGIQAPRAQVRAHSARALGRLGDLAGHRLLRQALATETDPDARVALVAALAQLRAEDAVADVLGLLGAPQEAGARAELCLALARLLRQETAFVRVWRQLPAAAGAALSRELDGVGRRLGAHVDQGSGVAACLQEASERLAAGALPAGCLALARAAALVTAPVAPAAAAQPGAGATPRQDIVRFCAEALARDGMETRQRLELATVAVVALGADDAGAGATG